MPASLLALAGAWISAHGLAQLWLANTGESPHQLAILAVAGALHLAWLGPATMRANPLLVGGAWLVTTWVCRTGFITFRFSSGLLPAVALEAITLALALSAGERASWADRLARWRRARQEITTQLSMGEGLAPWLRTSAGRLITGVPERSRAASLDRFAADLADAEDRLQVRIAAHALPEGVRQLMRASLQTLVGRAELATAQTSIALERQALEEAAACRDAIAKLPGLSAAEADAVAREGETLMLDLVHGCSLAAEPRRLGGRADTRRTA